MVKPEENEGEAIQGEIPFLTKGPAKAKALKGHMPVQFEEEQ